MVALILTVFIISLAWGVLLAVQAKKKRRSIYRWFALGFCFWFVPLFVLPFLRKLPYPRLEVPVFSSTQFPNSGMQNSLFL